MLQLDVFVAAQADIPPNRRYMPPVRMWAFICFPVISLKVPNIKRECQDYYLLYHFSGLNTMLYFDLPTVFHSEATLCVGLAAPHRET